MTISCVGAICRLTIQTVVVTGIPVVQFLHDKLRVCPALFPRWAREMTVLELAKLAQQL